MHSPVPQNVVAMRYFSGQLEPHAPKQLFVCVEVLATGQCISTLRTTHPLAGVTKRAGGCESGSILLNGQRVLPETYIARWRETQKDSQATLGAWLDQFHVSTTVLLPSTHTKPKAWVPPSFNTAKARLFGADASGKCTTALTSVGDVRLAADVLQGLAAFGYTVPSLSETLTAHENAMEMAVAA